MVPFSCLFTGGRPNEAASELLERAPGPRPPLPAGGAREGGVHLPGDWTASEYGDPKSASANRVQKGRPLTGPEALAGCGRVTAALVWSAPTLAVTAKCPSARSHNTDRGRAAGAGSQVAEGQSTVGSKLRFSARGFLLELLRSSATLVCQRLKHEQWQKH